MDLDWEDPPTCSGLKSKFGPGSNKRLARIMKQKVFNAHAPNSKRKKQRVNTTTLKHKGKTKARGKPGKQLLVGSVCSGLDTEIFSLEELAVNFKHLFSCEIDGSCRDVIQHNHTPEVIYKDALDKKDFGSACYVDLLAGGFPCQPFSTQGAGAGESDPLRGTVVLGIIAYLRRALPKVFFLENVQGLTQKRHAHFFNFILEQLRKIADTAGKPAYDIEWKILNTNQFGVAQNRPRVYIVGLRRNVKARDFKWPKPVAMKPIGAVVEKFRGKCPLPPDSQTHACGKVQEALTRVLANGENPSRVHAVVNCDSATGLHYMVGQSPCLTAGRAANGGHWLLWKQRRMTTSEMLKLQGMKPTRVKCPPHLSQRKFQHMIGNAFSQNVTTALLKSLLSAAGLA